VTRGVLRDGHSPCEDALDCVTVYGLTLSQQSVLHGAVRDAVDITQRASSVLVH
jgi:hypothetical protein